jgi:hypothetical protein
LGTNKAVSLPYYRRAERPSVPGGFGWSLPRWVVIFLSNLCPTERSKTIKNSLGSQIAYALTH